MDSILKLSNRPTYDRKVLPVDNDRYRAKLRLYLQQNGLEKDFKISAKKSERIIKVQEHGLLLVMSRSYSLNTGVRIKHHKALIPDHQRTTLMRHNFTDVRPL